MRKKIKVVAIYKPTETATFQVGEKIFYGEKDSGKTVESIKVGLFRTVKVFCSLGMVLTFKGLPYSIEEDY